MVRLQNHSKINSRTRHGLPARALDLPSYAKETLVTPDNNRNGVAWWFANSGEWLSHGTVHIHAFLRPGL